MKIAIAGAIALVVGLVGSMLVLGRPTEPDPAPAEAEGLSSSLPAVPGRPAPHPATAAAPDPAAGSGSSPDTVATPGAGALPPDAGGAALAAVAIAADAAPDRDEDPMSAPAGDAPDAEPQEGRPLSRVFSAMQPRDAARILQELADQEILHILAGLTERQSAAILSQMPPEQAARVTRALITRRNP